VKIKHKASGALLLKIFGANFPASGTIDVRADNLALSIFASSFQASDFISAKIPANIAPPSGTVLHITVRTPAGIVSNEATKAVP
jgi:hypothetical protein